MHEDADQLSQDHAVDQGVAQHLEQQCARAEEFFASERHRMEAIEAELIEQLDQLNSLFSETADGAQHAEHVATLEAELRHRAESLETAESEFKKAQEDVFALRAELDQRADELLEQQDRLNHALRRLANDEEQLEKEKATTRRQRRRIAGELKERRQELLQEIAQERALLEEERERGDQHATDDLDALTHERDQLKLECDRLQQQLDEQLAREEERGDAVSEEANQAVQSLTVERDELKSERDQLQERIVELESGTATASAEPSADLQDLQDRLELAMQDVRELKAHNEELEASLEAVSSAIPAGDDSAFDWEAQKLRLMASLDGNEEAPKVASEDRLTIEETVHSTDAAIAAMQQEMQQLRNQIADAQVTKDTDDADREQMKHVVDEDEIVKQERDNLNDLQDQMREKMRAAEVEISLERAKLAREKSDLEDKLVDLENVIDKRISEIQAENDGQLPKKRRRSRWRSRLGLDQDD